MNSTKRYTADELRAMAARGESKTDRARVLTKSEAGLDADIAKDEDWRGVSLDWHKNAEAVIRERHKVPISIRIDADLLAFFRAQGAGWQTRMNAVLRAYKEAVEAKDVR
jgi:uncharacterized protein (DUF4415 family)